MTEKELKKFKHDWDWAKERRASLETIEADKARYIQADIARQLTRIADREKKPTFITITEKNGTVHFINPEEIASFHDGYLGVRGCFGLHGDFTAKEVWDMIGQTSSDYPRLVPCIPAEPTPDVPAGTPAGALVEAVKLIASMECGIHHHTDGKEIPCAVCVRMKGIAMDAHEQAGA